jgi:uncharacterized integral membrane protein (TIGR00697 family)
MTDGLKIGIGDSWQPKYLSYGAMSIMGFMLITNVLNLKFIDVFGLPVIASELTYIISLILSDVMAEVYGYKRVRRLLYVGLAFLVIYAVFVQIAVYLPPAPGYEGDAAFKAVFSAAPRIVLASIVAYFVTELTASFVMSRLKIFFRVKYFYGRALASVGLAQLINGVVFFTIAYAGEMSFATIAKACAVSWTIVMGCEAIMLPLTKKLAWILKEYEGVEHFDYDPSAAPSRALSDFGSR